METQKQRILIVDDEHSNIDILGNALSEYEIFVAKNGEQALKRAVNIPAPDLILLDIIMQGMDGYEICRLLKSDEKTCDIPIIFVTSMNEVPDEARAFELGAVDYITKPFRIPVIKARVRTHLALKISLETLRRQNDELQKAVAEIKTLRGFLPICSVCKKIRDDEGYWQRVEKYIQDRSDAKFSHGLCPPCARKLYPNLTVPEGGFSDEDDKKKR